MFPFSSSAQSEFITGSPLGIKGDIAYSRNNNFTGFGGAMGISLFSLADFGIEYVQGSYDPKYNMESSRIMIYAAYNVKSNNNSFKALIGYSQISMNSKNFYSSDINVSGPIIELIFSPKIYENESIILIPSLGLSLGFLSASNGSIFNDYSDVENPRSIGVEFKIVSKLNREFYLIIAPSVSKDLMNSENSLILGFNLGFLFSIQEQ